MCCTRQDHNTEECAIMGNTQEAYPCSFSLDKNKNIPVKNCGLWSIQRPFTGKEMNNCVKWETNSKRKVNYSGFVVDFCYNCKFNSAIISFLSCRTCVTLNHLLRKVFAKVKSLS